MAERRELTTKGRITVDMPHQEYMLLKKEALDQGVSVRGMALKAMSIRRALIELQETGMIFVLQNPQGDVVDKIEASLFIGFLEMDPRLRAHFLENRTNH